MSVPTVGMTAEQRQKLWDLLRELEDPQAVSMRAKAGMRRETKLAIMDLVDGFLGVLGGSIGSADR